MKIENSNSEKKLLLRIARGDENAFRLLFDIYRNRLYYYTLQLTGSKELAEDIVQDSFLKVWLRRDLLANIEHFNAYLFKMAQNAVLNGLRRKAIEAAIVEGKLEKQSTTTAPDDILHFKLIKDVLHQQVNTLPEQQKKVYTLRRVEGYPIREIASTMNISEITVKRHLTEAQKTLRKAIVESFPSEAGIVLIIIGLVNIF